MYNRTRDTSPGCKSVVGMFDELKEYFMTQVSTPILLDLTPDIPICFVNFTALENNPAQTLNITEFANTTTIRTDCGNYCEPTADTFPSDFPPSFANMADHECSYGRFQYYCSSLYQYGNLKGLSYCEIYRLRMACALKVGCSTADWEYQDQYSGCINSQCSDCTPTPSWTPTDYPIALKTNSCNYTTRSLCEYYA